MSKTLPCKICGSESLECKNIQGLRYWIVCNTCGHRGKTGVTRTEAGKKWNNEHSEDIQ